jgi:hypothetical protein
LRHSYLVSVVWHITYFPLYRDDEEPPKDDTTAPSMSPVTAAEPTKPYIAPRVTRASIKKAPQARNLKRSKKAKETDVSLEAHASNVSPDDMSNFSLLAFLAYTRPLTCSFSQALLERFVALGTECAEYLKVAKASEGTILTSNHYFSSVLILCCLSDTLSSSSVAALATANARIASLEAELSASQKAYDVAAAAKANAEKS